MQSNFPAENAAMGVFLFLGLGVVLLIGLAISAVICWFVWDTYKRVPAQYRQSDPNMVWLLMIPCFNAVWNFFVFPQISTSLKSYFDSLGQTDVGDCGAQFGFIYCILFAVSMGMSVFSWVPLLGFFTGCLSLLTWIAALVLLGLTLWKFYELRNRLPLA